MNAVLYARTHFAVAANAGGRTQDKFLQNDLVTGPYLFFAARRILVLQLACANASRA